MTVGALADVGDGPWVVSVPMKTWRVYYTLGGGWTREPRHAFHFSDIAGANTIVAVTCGYADVEPLASIRDLPRAAR